MPNYRTWPSPPLVHDASNPKPVKDPGPTVTGGVHNASEPPEKPGKESTRIKPAKAAKR